MLRSSSSVARQGYLCACCEHSLIRARYRVSGAILCASRHDVVDADAKPFYCREYRVASDAAKASRVQGGGAA